MFKYVTKRVYQMILVLFVVSIIVFFVMSFTGDPVLMMVTPDATQAQIDRARMELGLDKPLITQYFIFVKNILRGDFGKSYVFKQSAIKLIIERMPATLELVFVSVLLSIIVAIPLGVFAGAFPNKKSSKTIMLGSLLGISLPNFWVGMMLIFVFAVHFRIMPSSGRGDVVNFLGMRISIFTPDGFRHIILPAIMLSVQSMAILLRLTRAGMMEVMKQDFIKFARSKGALQKTLLFQHALKNALIPVITVFGIQIGKIIAFATVTETIFSWPGMGKLLIDSINRSDRPVMVAYLMIVAFIFVLLNFIVDIVYTSIDPRIDLR